jgi:hypothetical protein
LPRRPRLYIAWPVDLTFSAIRNPQSAICALRQTGHQATVAIAMAIDG